MAKSRTRKKSIKHEPMPAELAVVVDQFTDYVKQWTDREIGKIRTANNVPVCIPIKDGYRLGNYRLSVFPNKTCELYNQYKELIHRFENKVSAILYTIYYIKQNYKAADEIMLWDKEINKNYTDMLSLRSSMSCAAKSKDYEMVDIRRARLEIAQSKLEFAQDKISKLHRHAKYIKVWE